jgi:hypothetical protein
MFYVDPAEAEHKRRQEEQYAISLKQQIEERRQAKEAERQARDRENQDCDAWLAAIVPRPPEPPAQKQPANATGSGPSEPPASVADPAPPREKPRRMIPLLKREFTTTLPAPRPMAAIEVSTESPFVHSTVPTPPPGFSRRRPNPDALPKRGVGETWEDYTRRDAPVRQSMPTRLLNPALTRGRVEQTSVRLGTNSELIYPDGHMSPVSFLSD